MPLTSRIGDLLTHNAVVITGSPKVVDKGSPTCRIGDLVFCPIHGINPIVSGNPKVVDDNSPTASIGDVAECGAVLITGASNVVDGGG